MKTHDEIKTRFQALFDQQADLSIKADLASKIMNQSVYSMCIDKAYKITIQMRELAWILDGDTS